MYAVQCTNEPIHNIAGNILRNDVFVHYKNVTFQTHDSINVLVVSTWVLVLIWKQSYLTDICYAISFPSKYLQLIDFSCNNIQEINNNCFFNNSRLAVLKLPHNDLVKIEPLAFAGLKRLAQLDLSFNNFKELPIPSLKTIFFCVLNISFNKFMKIKANIRNDLKAEVVSTEDYRTCCLLKSSDTICTSEPKWPQTCNVMFETKSIKLFCVVESIFIFGLNVVALLGGLISLNFPNNQRSKGSQSKISNSSFLVVILFLNVNDIFFGLYLLFMFIADKYYGDSYVVHEIEWLGSASCKALGILSILMMMFALFLLMLISVSRLIAVKYPFNTQIKSMKRVLKYIMTGYLSSSLFSAASFSTYTIGEERIFMPSSTCLLFGETLNSATIKCLTILIALLQIGVCVSVIVIYCVIIKENKLSTALKAQNSKEKDRNKNLLFQAFLISGTNVICWLPSSAIYFTSVIMKSYPLTLLTWNAVLINPINSMINPVIFYFVPHLKLFFQRKHLFNSFLLRKCK